MRRLVRSGHQASWLPRDGILHFVCLAFLLSTSEAKPNMTLNINLINNYSSNSSNAHSGLASLNSVGVKVSLPRLNPVTAESSGNPYSSARLWKSENKHSNGERQVPSDINENNEAHMLSTIDETGKMASVFEPPRHWVNNGQHGGENENRHKPDVSVTIFHHRAMHDPITHYDKGKPWHYYGNGYGLHYGYDLDGKYAREKGYQYEKALGRERCKTPECNEDYQSGLMKDPKNNSVQRHISNTLKKNHIDIAHWLDKNSPNKTPKPFLSNTEFDQSLSSSSESSKNNNINFDSDTNHYSNQIFNSNNSRPKSMNKTIQYFVIWPAPESWRMEANETTPRGNGIDIGASNRHRVGPIQQDNVVALFSNSNVYVTDQANSMRPKLVNAHPSSTNVFMPRTYLRRAKLYDHTPRPINPQTHHVYIDHYQHHHHTHPSESKDIANKQIIKPMISTRTKVITKNLNPSKADSTKWITKPTVNTFATHHWYIKPNKNWGADNNFGVEDATKVKSMPLNPKTNRHMHKTNTNLVPVVGKKKLQPNQNPYSQQTS